MKINSIPPGNIVERYQHQPLNKQSDALSGVGSDRVEFSGEALSFAQVFNKVKRSLDDRSREERDKFERIALQIEKGTYDVSSDEVADKIIGRSIDIDI